MQILTVHKDFDATPEGFVKSNTNSEYKIHIHKCYILDRKYTAPSTIHTIYFPTAHTSCIMWSYYETITDSGYTQFLGLKYCSAARMFITGDLSTFHT